MTAPDDIVDTTGALVPVTATRKVWLVRVVEFVVVGTGVCLPVLAAFFGLRTWLADVPPFVALALQGIAAAVGIFGVSFGLPWARRATERAIGHAQASARLGGVGQSSSSMAMPGLRSAAQAPQDIHHMRRSGPQ